MHVRRSCALSILVLVLSVSPLSAQCVSLTALGSAYTQDFNSLANSGTANTSLPIAERAASGSSRIYTIGADCSDRSGNTSHASTAVTVPKDQH